MTRESRPRTPATPDANAASRLLRDGAKRALSVLGRPRFAKLRRHVRLLNASPIFRWTVRGGSATVAATLAVLLAIGPAALVKPQFAAGAYTASSLDADGNTHLASNAVTDTYFYDTTTDSDAATQQKLGIDPNWKNGVTRKSYGLKFDGVNDYLDAGNPASLNVGTGSLTVAAWVKTTALVWGSIVDKKVQASNNPGYSLEFRGDGTYGGSVMFRIANGNSQRNINTQGIKSVNDGSWHSVVATADRASGRMALHVDGIVYVSTTFDASWDLSGTTPLSLGSYNNGAGSFYSGYLDDVRVYGRALSADEVRALYGRQPVSEAKLLARWNFDEGSGATAPDASTYGNDAALKNGTSNSPAADGTSNGPIWVSGSNAIMDGFAGCSPDALSCTPRSGQTGAGNVTLGAASSTTDDKSYELRITGSSGLKFDGSGSRVAVTPNAMPTSGTATIEFWARNDAISGDGVVLGATDASGNDFHYLNMYAYHNGKIAVSADWKPWAFDDTGVAAVPIGRWAHYSFVADTAELRLYLDGRKIWAAPRTKSPGQPPRINIGSRYASSYAYTGSVDEVRISDTVRFSSDFTPSRRLASDANTVGLWHLDEGSGTAAADSSGSGNDGTLTNGPMWTEGIATDGSVTDTSVQNPATFFQWREAGGAWSGRSQIPYSDAQLGSTGVWVRFNPSGSYSRYDIFRIASWAVEAFSTNSPQRGKSRAFPDRANIVTSSPGNLPGAVDIIDAETNKLWMRMPTGTDMANSLIYQGDRPMSATAKNGRIYIGNLYNVNSSLLELQMDASAVRRFGTGNNCLYNGTLSDRSDDLGYSGCAGTGTYKFTSGRNEAVAVNVISGKQYLVASAYNGFGYSGLSVLQDITSISQNDQTVARVRYSRSATQDGYSQVALSSGGTLYAVNMGASGIGQGLDRWDNVQNDAADRLGSVDATYTTVSTPALRSNVINDISVAEGASITDQTSNQVALATDLGADLIDEYPDPAKAQIRHYVKAGMKADGSAWDARQYGGALSFDGSSNYANLGNKPAYDFAAQNTYSIWFNATAPGDSPSMMLERFTGGTPGAGFHLSLSVSGIVQAEVRSDQGGASAKTAGMYMDGKWHLAVLRIDTAEKTVRLTVDNEEDVSKAYAGNIINQNAPLIAGGTASSYSFKGLLDDVRVYSRSLTDAEVTSLYGGAPASAPASGLVGYWDFNERSGQTVFDASGNGNDGTLGANASVGVDDPTRVIPAIAGPSDNVSAVGLGKSADKGHMLQFDGSDDVASGTGPELLDAWSISVWVKPSNLNGTTQFLISRGGPGWQRDYSIYLGLGTFRLQRCDGVTCTAVVSPPYSTNDAWYHLVGMTDGTMARLFVNGMSVASGNFTLNVPSDPARKLVIGSGYESNSYKYPFSGSLSDVRVYSRALSGSEISTLYNGGAGRSDNPVPGIAAWWKLADGGGQAVKDSAGSNHGTLGANASAASDDPIWTTGSPVRQQPALWIGSNGSGNNDGPITAISLATDRPVTSFTEAKGGLPKLDITSLSVTREGGLALVGTDGGAWNPGKAGFVVEDLADAPTTVNQPVRVKGGVRLKGGTRLK